MRIVRLAGKQLAATNSIDPGMGQERNICRIASDRLTLPVTFMNSRLGQRIMTGSRQAQIEINGKLVTADNPDHGNDRGHSLGNGPTYFTISRPMREKPWFIEYDDANGIRQKSWFNLNMP